MRKGIFLALDRASFLPVLFPGVGARPVGVLKVGGAVEGVRTALVLPLFVHDCK